MEPMANRPNKAFELLAIPKRNLPQLGVRYRVYSTATQYQVVDAPTAMEALKTLGIQSAYKITRDAPLWGNVLAGEMLGSNDVSMPGSQTIERETEGTSLLMAVEHTTENGEQAAPQA